MPASLHIGDGFARIGGVTLSARASARGLELGSDAVLRPVSFGLRSRLVAWSGDDLPGALLAEMMEGAAGGLDPLALQALALHLAGADSGAPGFAASAALVARLLGWPLADINTAEALEIDRLAASLAPSLEQADDSGWTTIHFSGTPDGASEDEALDAICARLTADLQRRAADGISQGQAAVLTAVAPANAKQQRGDGGASSLGGAGPAQTPGTALHPSPVSSPGSPSASPMDALLDPPPDPWKDQRSSAAQKPEFGATAVAALPVSHFAQPMPEPGPDAAVWAQPAVDGNPALAYQAGAESATPPRVQPGQAAGPGIASPATAPAALMPPADGLRSTNDPVFPAPAAGSGLSPAFVPPANLAETPVPTTNAPALAPTRAGLFWQAVVPPVAATSPSFEGANQLAPLASQPMTQPKTQASAEPALDLDGIADALHAAADLRGVAR